MAHPSFLLFFLGLFYVAHAAIECPKEKLSPGREVVCYSSVHDIEELTESICKCTTLIHQGHDLRNFSTKDIDGLRQSLKTVNPTLQFVISLNDPSNLLMTSATVRQEVAARIARLFNEVDGVELNVTAGSKERLFHFVKNLKDETVRKFQDKRILLNLPTKPEILAKQFDLKELAKYVDLFTVSTNYLVDEDEEYKTFHPSRMMGLFDMINTDSLVDLITGLGGPKRKLLISLPASAYKFTLKSETENTPRSDTVDKEPVVINRKELCETMNDGEWTIERDEDLTAPYAFKNQTWISFDDDISAGIKGKYVLIRDLAGIGIHEVENDQKSNCSNFLTHQIHRSFMDFKRKTRQAVLNSLEDDLHQAQISYSSNRVKSSEYRVVRVVDTEGHIRAVRENTQTEFSCPRQGYFVHPRSCNRFYRCVKFNQGVEDYSVFEFDCPAGLAFDERTEVCVWPHSLPEGSACPGSSEIAPSTRVRFRCPPQPGYYADKSNCRWFFACMDLGGPELVAYEFRCPFGLVFDEQRLLCEWPWLVSSCSDSGSSYTRTEYDNVNYGGETSDRGTSTQQHIGSFGFSGPASVGFSATSHAGATGFSGGETGTVYAPGFTGSTTKQYHGAVRLGGASTNNGQDFGSVSEYEKSSGAGHFATFGGQTSNNYDGSNSVHFGTTASGYSPLEHSFSPDRQYYGTTGGGRTTYEQKDVYSSAAGNSYYGSTGGERTTYEQKDVHSSTAGNAYYGSTGGGRTPYEQKDVHSSTAGNAYYGSTGGGRTTNEQKDVHSSAAGNSYYGSTGGERTTYEQKDVHSSTAGNAYYGSTGGGRTPYEQKDVHSSTAGNAYYGSTGGQYGDSKTVQHSVSNGDEYLHSTSDGHSILYAHTGHEGVYPDGERNELSNTHSGSINSDYSTATVTKGHSGHSIISGGYQGVTNVYSEPSNTGYTKSAGQYDGSINTGYSTSLNEGHYGSTDEYTKHQDGYFNADNSRSPGSNGGVNGLTSIGNVDYSIAGVTGSVSTGGQHTISSEYPSHTGVYGGSAGATVYSPSAYGSSNGGYAVSDDKARGTTVTYGHSAVSPSGGAYVSGGQANSAGTGYTSSYDTGSTTQFGYGSSFAGNVQDSGHTNTASSAQSASDGYVHTGVPTRSEYPQYTSFTTTGTHEGKGLSSTGSGLSSGIGYFSDRTKEYTSSGYSSESSHAGVDESKSSNVFPTGSVSPGQYIGFTSSQGSYPTNLYGHSETSGYSQSYGSTGGSLHPGQFSVTPTYYGGFTTDAKENRINVTLIDTSNSLSDNTQYHGSTGISTNFNLGSSSSHGHGFTEGHMFKGTGDHGFGSGVVTGQTVIGNSIQDTGVIDHSTSGVFLVGRNLPGGIEAGMAEPGYVRVSPSSPGYMVTSGIKSTHHGSTGTGTLVEGSAAPGILLTGTTAPTVIYNGPTSPPVYISHETLPSVSLGGTTAHRGSTESQYVNNEQSVNFHGSSKNTESGVVSYSGSTQTVGYSTISPPSQGIDQQILDYHNEKDIPDYRPSTAILPGTVVPGGIENIGKPVHDSHGLFEDQVNNLQTTSSGFSATSTGTHTQSSFTKTGSTKTGITVATLGGRGTYVISTGHPKPEINVNNIGEKAFEGNVAGHTETSTQSTYNPNIYAHSTSTAAPNIVSSSQSYDVRDIDTSKITLGPTGSTGYSYSKPSISFSSGSTAYSTDALTSTNNYNAIISSTTSKPLLNVQVYNTPFGIGSAPVTTSPEVIKAYSTSKYEEDTYQGDIYKSSKTLTDFADSTFNHKRPTVTILSSTSSPPLTYTSGPLDGYKTTIFDAAKIPVGVPGISTAEHEVPAVVYPVDYNHNRVTYNGGNYETVQSTVRPSPSYSFVETKAHVSPSSTPQYEQTFTTAKPQVIYGPAGSVTASTTKSIFEHNVTPSTIPNEEYGRKDQTKVTYASSSTIAPSLGVTYGKSLPSTNPDTFKGYVYPRPTISTNSGADLNRGYAMTVVGSSITTAGSITEQDIEKLVTNIGRGTLRYTPSYYESSADGKVTPSPAVRQSTQSPPETECEYGRKHTGHTHVSSGTPSPPIITTYSGGYSKLPSSTTPSYELTKPAVSVGKGKVIVKWSDLHPLLLGKLGAQCTCKADPFGTLRGPASKKLVASSRGQVDLSNYDESDIYVDIGSDESVEYKEASIAASGTPPADTYIPSVSLTSPSFTYLPSVSTNRPLPSFNSVTARGSLTLTSDNRSAKKLKDDGPVDSTIGRAGASFDRYGPGGLRDSEETLEGVSDCARPGLFRHPNFCNKFYACHWDEWKKKFTLHVFNCPVHLTFDSGVGACNWPSKGPACQDDNLLV